MGPSKPPMCFVCAERRTALAWPPSVLSEACGAAGVAQKIINIIITKSKCERRNEEKRRDKEKKRKRREEKRRQR